ncbi:helix-turn-helix domain-containing protein [Vagococcus vulneris]|uniref:PucR C-terminal helix-turn-helix domain-containing protein n=1 Tax=Vagococcus vulneris TaxID=1977869 RepID=A0A429ZX18_9ENTE|nr:helix-turn-helix domain-containing protein [Vagococcus vulneris]RST98387.1 hypothetical protein CBF37_07690 [Vagococcus vulneris]
MNLSELKKIYPNYNIENSNTPGLSNYLSLYVEGVWFNIPKKDLTEREIKLLQALFQTDAKNEKFKNRLWYNFLFNHQDIAMDDGTFRIFQLKLPDTVNKSVASDWLTCFTALFHSVEDYFFITETYAIVIEKKEALQYSDTDIEGMILTLESDFLLRPELYIGMYQPMSNNFTETFKEEQRIFFNYQVDKITSFSFQSVALQYLTKESIEKSSIMQSIRLILAKNQDMHDIVTTLWQEQGNLASTAKKMYLHRNTLQYRMDKFYERTGLSLKNMTDLTLCYLIISHP